MQHILFKRLLDLSKRTGDRIVFADMDGKEAYVVLPLDDYERLALGAGQEKINEKIIPIKVESKPVFTNPLEEMNKEVVRSLEAERAMAGAQENARVEAEPEMEIEERYYLEPIE